MTLYSWKMIWIVTFSIDYFECIIKTTHRPHSLAAHYTSWRRYDMLWEWINSQNYLNIKYSWCFKLPFLEEITSLFPLFWLHFQVTPSQNSYRFKKLVNTYFYNIDNYHLHSHPNTPKQGFPQDLLWKRGIDHSLLNLPNYWTTEWRALKVSYILMTRFHNKTSPWFEEQILWRGGAHKEPRWGQPCPKVMSSLAGWSMQFF